MDLELGREITPPSTDDDDRKELPWEYREEKLLLLWCNDCKKRSLAHNNRGKKINMEFGF